MKVIDLLNKIANGEELPKKIKYQGDIYSYDEEFELYMLKGEEISLLQNVYECDLTDEIEIIEEPKKTVFRFDKDGISMCAVYGDEEIEEDKEIEEINVWYEFDGKNNDEIIYHMCTELKDKINELIKAVNELKKGK